LAFKTSAFKTSSKLSNAFFEKNIGLKKEVCFEDQQFIFTPKGSSGF
jgi:hypothetical protein